MDPPPGPVGHPIPLALPQRATSIYAYIHRVIYNWMAEKNLDRLRFKNLDFGNLNN